LAVGSGASFAAKPSHWRFRRCVDAAIASRPALPMRLFSEVETDELLDVRTLRERLGVPIVEPRADDRQRQETTEQRGAEELGAESAGVPEGCVEDRRELEELGSVCEEVARIPAHRADETAPPVH